MLRVLPDEGNDVRAAARLRDIHYTALSKKKEQNDHFATIRKNIDRQRKSMSCGGWRELYSKGYNNRLGVPLWLKEGRLRETRKLRMFRRKNTVYRNAER